MEKSQVIYAVKHGHRQKEETTLFKPFYGRGKQIRSTCQAPAHCGTFPNSDFDAIGRRT